MPYANGDIHIGHLVEYLQTDFWVRFQKMRGNECIYVCADDTHGTPIMISAAKKGVPPEDFIAESYKRHVEDFSAFDVKFDNFYSTNSPENKAFCEQIYVRLRENGALREERVPQLFCPNDKMFLPDRFVRGKCPKCGAEDQYGDSCEKCGSTYNPSDLVDGHCAICGEKKLETRESSHIFFELRLFKEYLREWLSGHVARDISNKLLEWFGDNAELMPWDISRDAPYFGFEIPDHPGKYFYVWLDAPVGYMASFKNFCSKHGLDFESWWNGDAEIYHFIGKDIVRFHCLFWPAMLHASGFRGPTQVFVHGFLTVNGTKMSKSRGTFISASTYRECLDPQFLRYYYACKINNTTDDVDLNLDDFAQRVNSDLIGKITNLASRGAQMINKRLGGILGTTDEEGRKILDEFRRKSDCIASLYEERKFSQIPVEICRMADTANEYFDSRQPWATVKTDPELTRITLTNVLNMFRILAVYLAPILPGYASKTAALFNEAAYTWDSVNETLENKPIGAYEYLASRIEKDKIDLMVEKSKQKTPQPEQPKSDIPEQKPEIDIGDFGKTDMRVGLIRSAELVDGSDKLLCLSVDFGPLGTRKIFSGIRKSYPQPEAIVGKKVIAVVNLKPRKMRFGTSEGMLICSGTETSGFSLISPLSNSAAPGDPIS